MLRPTSISIIIVVACDWVTRTVILHVEYRGSLSRYGVVLCWCYKSVQMITSNNIQKSNILCSGRCKSRPLAEYVSIAIADLDSSSTLVPAAPSAIVSCATSAVVAHLVQNGFARYVTRRGGLWSIFSDK